MHISIVVSHVIGHTVDKLQEKILIGGTILTIRSVKCMYKLINIKQEKVHQSNRYNLIHKISSPSTA